MGVDPTEGEPLPVCIAAVFEGAVCKLSVDAMVVEDVDTILLSKVFEGSFGFHGLFGGKLGQKVDILESQVVVDEDGGCCIVFLGECFPSAG